MAMNTRIGAHEAQTRLPALLRQVRAGHRFTITYRGAAIADLVPSLAARPANAGAAIDRFLAFMCNHPVSARNVNVHALIADGRE